METDGIHDLDRALVLGPGGRLGTAWMAGLTAGLHGFGVELGEADLIVGTSAGAIVGAVLATGQDPSRLAALPARPPADASSAPRRPDPAMMGAVFAVLGNPSLDPADARRQVGRIALETLDDQAENRLIAQRAQLTATESWPRLPLLIPAVDAETGEPIVWDAAAGVPLVRAVAASSAFPGAEPPVTVDGRRYLDGALRDGTNTDLAAGARTVVVIDPLAHRHPRPRTDGAHLVAPDPATARLLDAERSDPEAWTAAYQAGEAQAGTTAEELRAHWRPATDRSREAPDRPAPASLHLGRCEETD
ncbi:patatin-like phospholipase family protein [Streptomyces rhizosphaericus]|uniref:Patatin-like phospholipase family protein n=1 Tax=Streptomyces rhizosphaericus TaxID=114699 RepID=A0A6G4AL91_9ACTN|nr:patatin-like phospholipase family protein [Streptomyces rhizosphaericus]NEW74133.1 patatin-like phospholipase family protein [Streptomyces rhizosphaericus]